MKKKSTANKLRFIILLIVTVALLLLSFFAENIVPSDPYEQDLSQSLQPPNSEHLFGTDRYGRDMLSRVLVGAKTTVFSALLLVIAVSLIGTAIGVVCAYREGRLDIIVMRISDIFLAFPGMVLAIAVAGILGGGMSSAMMSLALISWPKYARIARSQVLSVKNSSFISAAKLSGCPWYKIILLHLLPNIVGPIIVTVVLDIGTMMLELAGLSFLGLGAMPPVAEWGSMMSSGRSMLQTSPWVILTPGFAIFITVMLFNLLGDSVRDLLDPKRQK